jgi:uncharacterized membrane protein
LLSSLESTIFVYLTTRQSPYNSRSQQSLTTIAQSPTVIIINPHTIIMKTFAIAAVLAASAAATPTAAVQKRAITPVTVKGNGMFNNAHANN